MLSKHETLNYNNLIKGVDGALEFFLLNDEDVRSFLFSKKTGRIMDLTQNEGVFDVKDTERWFVAQEIKTVFDLKSTASMTSKISDKNKKIHGIKNSRGVSSQTTLINRKGLCEVLLNTVTSARSSATARQLAFKDWLFNVLLEEMTMLEMEKLEKRNKIAEALQIQEETKAMNEYYNRHVESSPEVITLKKRVVELESRVDSMQRIATDPMLGKEKTSAYMMRELAEKRKLELKHINSHMETIKMLSGRPSKLGRKDFMLLSDVVKAVESTSNCTMDDFYQTLGAFGYLNVGRNKSYLLKPFLKYVVMFRQEFCIKKQFATDLFFKLQDFNVNPETFLMPPGFNMRGQARWVDSVLALTNKTD